MYRYCLLFFLWLGVTGRGWSSSWADALFDEVSRNFGTVPRASILTHPFRLVNNTKTTVQISGVRVSCGCVTARALQTTLAPGQESAILVQMDPKRFSGPKSVTVYVAFCQPRVEEVRLWVNANSCEDVAIVPEALAFGRTKRGSSPTTSVTVSFLGNDQTEVTALHCDSNYVEPSCKLIRKDAGEVSYQLSATLHSEAPVGKWFTDIWLKTTNPAMPRIRVPLTVEIESPLTVSPQGVSLGQIKLATETDRQVVIRGVRPFRITGITGTDREIMVRDSSPESQKVHVLTVTLRPTTPGEFKRTIHIHTDLKTGGDIEFAAQAQVIK